MPAELVGWRIAVTRPAHQSAPLTAAIEAAGGTALSWPAIEIVPASEPMRAQAKLAEWETYQLVVFVSANAVRYATELMGRPFAAGPQVASVGEGTARALAAAGRPPDLCPTDRYDSEAVLALPHLQHVVGWRVLIVRGEGGRELMADTLRARGAQVEYAEVYRRLCPASAPPVILQALSEGSLHAVTVTSAEGLRHLVTMAGALSDALRQVPLVVMSERHRPVAEQLGFRAPIVVARAASDEATLDALIALARSEKTDESRADT